MYDPASGKFTLISTCFPTHRLIFAEDANNTLWVSSGVQGPGAFGWLNRKMFEETGDEVKSQGRSRKSSSRRFRTFFAKWAEGRIDDPNEASALPVTRSSRSSATRSIDNSLGGFFLH